MFKRLSDHYKRIFEKYLTKQYLSSKVVNNPPSLILSKNLDDKILVFVDIDPLESARQITLKTFDLYKKIQSIELYDMNWM